MIKTPNFVLFVSFVVKIHFSALVAALPRWVLRGECLFTNNQNSYELMPSPAR
jgi:hypothetical protein